MENIKRFAMLVLFLGIMISGNYSSAQSLESTIDNIISENYSGEKPGATALVYKDGKTLYRNAVGMANLELGVAMKPENVIEIGSITKQFTAVAILMLEEQGKLSVDDEISKFIPDYPAKGKKITIHQLLNHTSGIKSYTSMQSFMSLARQDMTPTALIDHFKNEEMDFDPGEEWSYNNSGYIILGHIIEVASKKTYSEFIEDNIFIPLGMKSSYYGSKTALIPNRAMGYSPVQNGWRNADYISLTLPYAAGSIMSTVDDMLVWHKAIHANTLITSDSKNKAFTNTKLNNGDPTNYGYGWMINEINGTSSIEHGGGIFGYTTSGIYIPSENLYVIVLTNRDGSSPGDVAVKIAAHALGKPYLDSTAAVSLKSEQLKKWVGNYEFDKEVIRSITFDDGKLYSQREGGGKSCIFPVSENNFIFEDGLDSYKFTMVDGKKIANFSARGNKEKGVETDKKPATEKEEITIDSKILPEYVGAYELAPSFVITVTTEDGKLLAQATGQPRFQVFPEAEDTFFLKVVAAKIVFGRDDNGKIIDLTLHQGGQEMKGVKK
jgi:CubicO group peptidase (beta-lactamase class C family)